MSVGETVGALYWIIAFGSYLTWLIVRHTDTDTDNNINVTYTPPKRTKTEKICDDIVLFDMVDE